MADLVQLNIKVPPSFRDWLRAEAARRTEKEGRTVTITEVVVRAIIRDRARMRRQAGKEER